MKTILKTILKDSILFLLFPLLGYLCAAIGAPTDWFGVQYMLMIVWYPGVGMITGLRNGLKEEHRQFWLHLTVSLLFVFCVILIPPRLPMWELAVVMLCSATGYGIGRLWKWRVPI